MRQIAVILNLHKPYDRQVLQGIADYARERGDWSMYVEDEPEAKVPNPKQWRGDGIIADIDDVTVKQRVSRFKLPMVTIGGANPKGVPFVATDNEMIGELGAGHLLERGVTQFAWCGLPDDELIPWAIERERAYCKTLEAEGYVPTVYRGRHRTARDWEGLQRSLIVWVESLPKPVGIMACRDARARHVMEACRRLDLHVPDDVAIIGVDNDPLCDMSTPTLSSIQQGTHEIGWRAAETLDKLMRGRRTKKLRVVPPTGVVPRQSTNLLTNSDEMVIAAQQFIRDHANSPIQVADIVEHVGAPRITLDRRFKKALECTVHEELTRFRVECVQTMLRDTNLSIAAIARRMGFSSAQYLNAAFKSYCDMTPGEYRSRHC